MADAWYLVIIQSIGPNQILTLLEFSMYCQEIITADANVQFYEDTNVFNFYGNSSNNFQDILLEIKNRGMPGYH